MTMRWALQPDVPAELPPDALELLMEMANATTIHDAHELAVAAVKAGATGEQVRQAITEWMDLQARQVQQVFADQRRPDCCTGIERQHVTAAMDRHPAGRARCKCDGFKDQHGTDRRGRPLCFHSSVCGCTQFREKDQ